MGVGVFLCSREVRIFRLSCIALQVACIAHFQHVPLSQLAPATMCSAQVEDMELLIEAIPEAQLPFLRQQVLRSSQSEVHSLNPSARTLTHSFSLKQAYSLALNHNSPCLDKLLCGTFLSCTGFCPALLHQLQLVTFAKTVWHSSRCFPQFQGS